MKTYVIITILCVFVWLSLLVVQLSADQYPRRRVVQRSDDAAKAILLVIFWLAGIAVLLS